MKCEVKYKSGDITYIEIDSLRIPYSEDYIYYDSCHSIHKNKVEYIMLDDKIAYGNIYFGRGLDEGTTNDR